MDFAVANLQQKADSAISGIEEFLFYFTENFKYFFFRLGSQQSYACLAEIRQSFEQRRGGQMTADMEYATIFVDTVDAFPYLPSKQREFPTYVKGRVIALAEV